MNITDNSLKLFLKLAKDAASWDGQPMLDGMTKEQRGNLTQLKVAGLVTTDVEDGITWVSFTDEGITLAAQHGITI